ncbi:MAG: metal ABC transporter permease [Alphaproteobacteria bacterium GM7ARS4]|nr:metal ABC transporter permease [Alphaproteobacteria bacterium GM7ARS4]
MLSTFIQHHYNALLVLITTALSGATLGMIGVLALMRKQAMLSDALAHATLPGIACAFILFAVVFPAQAHSAPYLWLLIGATWSSLCAIGLMTWLNHHHELSTDAAIATIISVFFPLGVVLLSYIQTLPIAGQAGLDRFLLGSVATMTLDEALTTSLLAIALSVLLLVWKKELFAFCFDEDFCHAHHIDRGWGQTMILTLILLATVIGLQTIGLILLIALLITPAASAWLVTRSFRQLLIVSMLLGSSACLVGGSLSYLYPHWPSGALIVLILTSQFFLALLYHRYKTT